MTEIEALRAENGALQKRIDRQRQEIKRLSAEVVAISSLMHRYSKMHFDLCKEFGLPPRG
jgi:hypothetical protein